MQVEYLYYEGQPSEVIPPLRRSIGQYHRYYEHVKIGITAAPERRFQEHLKREKKYCWERMVVKYRTKSIRNANKIEDFFIEKDERMRNIWTGTSHMTPVSDYYYAYILLGNHRHYKI
jgi:hypothetical protein